MLPPLGIKLVILMPSFLFLIGFVFKGIIEKNHLEKINLPGSYNRVEIYLDFIFLFSFESLFLVATNGLIMIYELSQSELGIILIFVGLILSSAISIGAHIKHPLTCALGFGMMFYLIGWELGYFWDYNLVSPDQSLVTSSQSQIFRFMLGIISTTFGSIIILNLYGFNRTIDEVRKYLHFHNRNI
jgi:hypothetical protein